MARKNSIILLMKTFLEVEENWKDRIEDLITFPAQDYLLNLQEKMNRLKEISSYLRTHFFRVVVRVASLVY